jgi:hypothetical protein
MSDTSPIDESGIVFSLVEQFWTMGVGKLEEGPGFQDLHRENQDLWMVPGQK